MKVVRSRRRFGPSRLATPLLLLAACGAATGGPLNAQPESEPRVLWMPIPMALLRIDDRPPKNWQVYGAEKRKHALLVQIGGRFLLLDVQAKRVYEIAPRTLTRTGETLQWRDSTESARPAAKQPALATPRQPAESRGATETSDVARRGAERELPDKALLPSSGWTMRDVGPMLRIRLRLTSEGRDFDIQIPIQPDLRQFY